MKNKKKQDFMYRRSTQRGLWALLIIACVLSIAGEAFVHRHGHFEGIDDFPAFYAILGFTACTGMIIAAKLLGRWLKASENYYDDDEPA